MNYPPANLPQGAVNPNGTKQFEAFNYPDNFPPLTPNKVPPASAKYGDVDFSNKPSFMSMEQYAHFQGKDKAAGTGDFMSGPMPQPKGYYSDQALGTLGEMSAMSPPPLAQTTDLQDGGTATTRGEAPAGLEYSATPGGGTVGLPPTTPPTPLSSDVPSREQLAKPGTAMYDAMNENQQIDMQTANIADKMGLTGEERDRFIREQSQQGKIASAKEGIAEGVAGRSIVKSLQKQGMTEEEIRSAIGADQNPNMSKSQAVTKLKELQNKKQMQGASPKITRQSEKIAGMDDEDSIRFMEMEDALSGTGDDPLGETLSSQMTPSQRKEYDRLRTKVADRRAHKEDFTRMDNLLKRSKNKSTRTRLNREAKEAKSKATTQEKNIESLIKSRDDRKVYQEEKAKRDALYKTWQGTLKTDFAGTAEETRLAKEAYENFTYSFEGTSAISQEAKSAIAALEAKKQAPLTEEEKQKVINRFQ